MYFWRERGILPRRTFLSHRSSIHRQSSERRPQPFSIERAVTPRPPPPVRTSPGPSDFLSTEARGRNLLRPFLFLSTGSDRNRREALRAPWVPAAAEAATTHIKERTRAMLQVRSRHGASRSSLFRFRALSLPLPPVFFYILRSHRAFGPRTRQQRG